MPKKRDTVKSQKANELWESTGALEKGEAKGRSRIRYACKPELQELLNIINLIPPDQEMKNSGGLYENEPLLKPGARPSQLEQEIQRIGAFEKYLESFPVLFRKLVIAAGGDSLRSLISEIEALPPNMDETEVPDYWEKRIEIFKKQIDAYDQLRMMRVNLFRFAEIGKEAEKYLGKELDVVLGVLLLEYAYLDNEGKIRREPNRFAEIIEGVEASRIRSCLVCKKLFWAYRKDKWCCSEEHSSIIRQRQSRINKKAKGKVYAKFAKLKEQRQKDGQPLKKPKGVNPKESD